MLSRLFLGNLRAEARSLKWLGLLVPALLPLVQGLSEVQQGVFRDRLDIVSVIQTSPLVLVLPLVVTTFTSGHAYAEVRNRFTSLVIVRSSHTEYMLSRLSTAAVTGFAIGIILALPALVTAFVVWPLIGDPAVDPAVYHLSPEGAEIDSFWRFSFSELLVAGATGYSIFYACWLGLGCAALAALGVTFLLALPNRFLALALPFLLYIGESVLASVLGQERAAVMFAFFPFGLNQATLASAVTGALMIVAVAGYAAWAVARARSLGNLQ